MSDEPAPLPKFSHAGLKARRVAASMSQNDLAHEATARLPEGESIWGQDISRYETDRTPNGNRLPALATALGCSIDDLFKEPA